MRALGGPAEAIPLPDGSVDAVLCAQSLHWFDMSRAIPEIARVLRGGGVLAGLWNCDDSPSAGRGLCTNFGNCGSTSCSWLTPIADTTGET